MKTDTFGFVRQMAVMLVPKSWSARQGGAFHVALVERDRLSGKRLMEQPKSKKWPLMVGVALSSAYLIGLSIYLGDFTRFWALKPTEMGSFLGGAFAPLAFLWLVLGFFQQGEELRNSADALWLQGEELRNAVEQQKNMVGLTREQIDHEKSRDLGLAAESERMSQPRFKVTPTGSASVPGGSFRKHTFQISNTRSPCTDVRINIETLDEAAGPTLLHTGSAFEIAIPFTEGLFEERRGEIAYLDTRGIARNRGFSLIGKGSDVSLILDPDSSDQG